MKALIPQVVQMIYFGSLSIFLVGSQLVSGGSFDVSKVVAFLASLALLIDPIQVRFGFCFHLFHVPNLS